MKVSIIIPTYNREKYLKAAIESALAQSYDNYEIIIVDDGSTDATQSIIHFYTEKFPQKVFSKYQNNSGATVARNNGLRMAQGELIAFLDSDDLYAETKLEQQVSLFKSNPDRVELF